MNLDRDTLRLLRDEINAALASVGEKHGLRLLAGSASFSDLEATFKLVVSQASAEGQQQLAAKAGADFAAFAPLLGLDAEWFGKTIRLNGAPFEVVGVDPGKPKNCVKLRRLSDGKAFKCPPATVRAAIVR
jgi:hypothetical protein